MAEDIEAADWLDRQLSVLVDKLDSLNTLRSSQRKALLGDSHSDNWQGARRNQFENDFGREKAAFADLKSAALSLRGSVRDALEKARKDND